MKILFLHGWCSIVGGVKPTYLQQAGHEISNPALDDDDFEAGVAMAQAAYNKARPDVVVGSSRGGAIAMNIDTGDVPMVLLCPAWRAWGSATTVKSNTIVLHSSHDDVIPFGHSEELIANSRLPSYSLIEVGSDHRLAEPEPLRAMLDACERLHASRVSILEHPAISGRYLFTQARCIDDPFIVKLGDAELACYRRMIDPHSFTVIHFHGNGEAVADYVPDFADTFARLGLNSLFVEYRGYGGSSGDAKLVSMLGDGEAAMKAAELAPEMAIVFGRSIGSLYAIELARRQPAIAGLVLESGIANPAERFLTRADFAVAGVQENDVIAETKRHFNHKAKLAGYSNPLLTMHTENDGVLDISHGERNHKLAASRQKRLVRFKTGNHNTIFRANETEYLDAISQFVRSLSP